MKKIFVTYGNERYALARSRLRGEAVASGWFDQAWALDPEGLTVDFRQQFAALLRLPRGAGYWGWKLDVLEQAVQSCSKGDIVVYCDAGCKVNLLGGSRFDHYVEQLQSSEYGMIGFQMAFPERNYTTEECFHVLGVAADSPHRLSGQICATVLVLKVSEHASEILAGFRKVITDFPLVITDYFNGRQGAWFVDHRHDQSIFSVLRKLHGCVVIPDETWFDPFGCPESLQVPFWATRLCDPRPRSR